MRAPLRFAPVPAKRTIVHLDAPNVTGKMPVWFDDLKAPMDDEEVYGPLDAPERIATGSTFCASSVRDRVITMSTLSSRGAA